MSSQFISHCTADALGSAARALKDGALVAFPTETVYGLGADASNPDAVARIYKVKGRPADHPLIVHVGSMEKIEPWVSEIPDYAIALARTFWPGPMTLILKRSALAHDFITGGQATVGVRVPDHTIALALLDACHKNGIGGVAAPSANRFGHVSPTTSDAVREELGEYLEARDVILDGGQSQVGVESTIIDCTQDAPRILRPGAITREMIEDATGIVVTESGEVIRVSGSLEQHYSPAAQVVLDKTPESGDGFIAMKSIATPEGAIRLAQPGSIEEFARTLYSALRKADSEKIAKVCVEQPLGEGLAIAIRDRLKRAASPR